MSHKSVRMVILAAAPAVWLGGCNLVADLSQFDNAKNTADASDGSVAASSDAPDVQVEATVVDEGGGETDAADGARADVDDGQQDASDAASDVTDSAGMADVDLGPPDLIANGGFELGTGPWTSIGNVTVNVTSSPTHSGQFAAWVHNRMMGDYEGVLQDITANIVQGHTYTVTAYAMVGMPSDGGLDAEADAALTLQQLYMTVAVTCVVGDGGSDTGYTPLDVVHTGNSTSWTTLSGYFQMPVVPFTFSDASGVMASCTKVTQVRFYVAGPPAGVDLFVDDVSFLR